jgi:hypothetical protein
MRIPAADASLLSDPCDYLSLQGYVVVEASPDEAGVLCPRPAISKPRQSRCWRSTNRSLSGISGRDGACRGSAKLRQLTSTRAD